MEIRLTVAATDPDVPDASGTVRADLLVDVDGTSSIADLGRELDRVLGRGEGAPADLYIAGHRVAADLAVESSPYATASSSVWVRRPAARRRGRRARPRSM